MTDRLRCSYFCLHLIITPLNTFHELCTSVCKLPIPVYFNFFVYRDTAHPKHCLYVDIFSPSVLKEPTFPVCLAGCECGGASRRCRTIRRLSSSRRHTQILLLLRETSALLQPRAATQAQVSIFPAAPSKQEQTARLYLDSYTIYIYMCYLLFCGLKC